MLKTILVCCDLYYLEDGDRFGNSIFDYKENELRERVWCNSGSREAVFLEEYYVYTFIGGYNELKEMVKQNQYKTIDY